MKDAQAFADVEIGLVYLELAHRLLRVGGRVGIVLPETYFFSHSYRWLPGWMDSRLALRGMLNIPMEAFEEFCRAKTNFYIFEKIGEGTTTEQPKKAEAK
jgi:type I restriction enzyme M protein